MKKIVCPHCKTEALPGGMLRDEKIAKCHECLGWFDYEKPEQLQLKKGSKPDGIPVITEDKNTTIQWRHTEIKGIWGVLGGLPLGIYTTTLWLDAIVDQRWGYGAVNLLLAVIGALLTYGGLINLLNRIEITLTPEQFLLNHKPVPVFDNRNIPLEKIEAVTLQKNIGLTRKKKPFVFYDLFLKTTWNETVIIPQIRSRKEALYLREMINATLSSLKK